MIIILGSHQYISLSRSCQTIFLVFLLVFMKILKFILSLLIMIFKIIDTLTMFPYNEVVLTL
jgi:hypothetical protein